MSTRAASAATALRAKQELIRLLSRKLPDSPVSAAASSFVVVTDCNDSSNKDNSMAAFDGDRSSSSRRHDHHHHHSMYSYNDLRSAYLERIHVLHPDKTKYQTLQDKDAAVRRQGAADDDGSISSSSSSKRNHHDDFVALQVAWKRYDVFVKSSLLENNNSIDKNGTSSNNTNGGFTEGSFTMFGVGCSFSDNETERALREEITNQACRGWFSAGQLEPEVASSSGKSNDDDDDDKTMSTTLKTTKGDDASRILLSDGDDMFVQVTSHENEPEAKCHETNRSIYDWNNSPPTNSSNSSESQSRQRRSLIDHMIPRRNHGK
jgi:hypothetical protein